MSIVFYQLAPDLGSRLWHWSCSQFSMSSGHEGAGVNRRPECASRWESIPAPSGPSPPEFLSHSGTPNYSEEAEGSLSCSAHSKALKLVLLTDRFLPHAGSSRVYYYNLYENLVSQYPDQVTVLTKKVPGWQEFDRRESGVLLKIVRRFHPSALEVSSTPQDCLPPCGVHPFFPQKSGRFDSCG